MLHDSSRTGRQMPLVNVAGPQSQPKLHAALRIACDYARQREVFGRPIGANQGLQFPLAQLKA